MTADLIAQAIDELRTEVRYLRDVEEIRQLIYQYVHCADSRGREDELASTFAPDGVLVLAGEPLTPPAKIATMMKTMWSALSDDTVWGWGHTTSNVVITVEGDRAHAESYVSGAMASGGRYIDDLVRHEGRWCFQRREVVMPEEAMGPDSAQAKYIRQLMESD